MFKQSRILDLLKSIHSGSQRVLFPNEKFPFERHGKRKKTSDGNFCGKNKKEKNFAMGMFVVKKKKKKTLLWECLW